MVWRTLWRIADTLVVVVFLVAFAILFVVFFLPIYALMSLVETVTGEGRWCRQQIQRMVTNRARLSDVAFLEMEHVPTEDAQLWIAVRRAVADSVGLPPEAIYPEDQTPDLWRIQLVGPDALDVIFRLERLLGVEIPPGALGDELFGNEPREFRQFAAAVVSVLRGIQPKPTVLQRVMDANEELKG